METRPTTILWRSGLGADEAARLPGEDGIRLIVEPDAERAEDHLREATVLVDGDPPERLLDGDALRHVIVPYAGIRSGLRRRIEARPRLSLHNSHFNAPFVAQHAFALLLACAGRLGRFDRSLRRGDWCKGGPDSVHLAGGQALLVGYGAIGRALVPMLRGVGMEPVALRRSPDARARDPREVGPEALAEAVEAARAVVVSLPGTDATRGMLGREVLSRIRPDALLVNVGRGSVVDEDALWEVLQEGRPAGVGLDVWWRYPDGEEEAASTLPARRPFHLHPDVILSPHRANAVHGWRDVAVRDVLETVRVLARGGQRNRVDPGAGY